MPTDKKPFSEKMVDILNYGALNLAMGIGYRAGLFDVMDAAGRPCTLDEICGEIVDLSRDDVGQPRFSLPPAHGDMLTRRAGSDNLGVYSQEIPLLTNCAVDHVYRGFLTGEGIPYDHYPEFHDFMAELGNAKHHEVLVDDFLPSVDDGRMVQKLQRGITVCDLGCAQGVATILMAEAFPNSRFTGIDISAEALETARADAEERGLANIRFELRDAAELHHPGDLSRRFDYITAFDAIHDQTRPMLALRGIYEILKDDGAFSMIDIAAETDIAGNREHPMGAFLYTVSLMHCMPVGLVDNGAGLGMMWGRQLAEKMLAEAGFGQVSVMEIPNDPFNLHFFCRK